LFSSCTEEDITTNDEPLLKSVNTKVESVVYSNKPYESTQTIIGEKLVNPYSVENMESAYESLTGINKKIDPSDYYIKILVNHPDDYDLIEESDLFVFDHPLGYKMIHVGDYYKTEDDYKSFPVDLYTVIKDDFEMPAGLDYELIESLYLPPYNSELTKEAFEITENEWKGDTSGFENCCNKFCPIYLECLEDPSLSVNCGNIDCDDSEIGPEFDPPGVNPAVTDCGCPSSLNTNLIAGCVRYDNTQFAAPNPFQRGVKRVQVNAWDEWFRILGVTVSVPVGGDETDVNGCFKIVESVEDDLHLYVKWKNQKAKIRRGVSPFIFYRHHEILAGTPKNNISLLYTQGGDERAWWASHIINGVWGYEFYGGQIDLEPHHDHLNILMGNLEVPIIGPLIPTPAAPMFDKGGLSQYSFESCGGGTEVGGALAGLINQIQRFFLIIPLPDLVFDDPPIVSDGFHDVVYHELSHATHYKAVGEDYWRRYRTHILSHFGYGTPPFNEICQFPEEVALGEAWGFHIGPTLAHLHYGDVNSIPFDWERRIEGRFLVDGYIPIGLFHDLKDVNGAGAPGENAIILGIPGGDVTSGISEAALFDIMSEGTSSFLEIRNSLPITPNSDDIFQAYFPWKL